MGALIAISTFIRAEAAARFDGFFLTRTATPSDVVIATSSQWRQPERTSRGSKSAARCPSARNDEVF